MSNYITEEINPALLEDPNVYEVHFYNEVTDELLYTTSVKIDDPYDIDYGRLIPNEICSDLQLFFTLASDIISDAQKLQDTKKVKLIEDFSPEEFHTYGNEVITFSVVSRTPGNMNPKADARPQRRPSFSHNLRLPEHANRIIEVSSMPKDHEIEFSCWSKTASIANKRALWLEKLFINNSYLFKVKGVERFYWIRRNSDRMMLAGGQRIYERPLRFFVRLRDFHSISHPIINQLTVNLDIT